MTRTLFSTIAVIFTIGLSISGCGEDVEEEPAKILQTNPENGGDMFINGILTITFDKTVTEVKVNGIPADIDGTQVTWKSQGINVGRQNLEIEWTDENGNVSSEEITLMIQEADLIVCFCQPIMATNG